MRLPWRKAHVGQFLESMNPDIDSTCVLFSNGSLYDTGRGSRLSAPVWGALLCASTWAVPTSKVFSFFSTRLTFNEDMERNPTKKTKKIIKYKWLLVGKKEGWAPLAAAWWLGRPFKV